MSLTPMLPGDAPVHLLERGDEERGEEEAGHDALLRCAARRRRGPAVSCGGGHATLLSTSASSSTRAPRESFRRHSSESDGPSRLPSCQRRWRSSSASRIASTSSEETTTSRAGVADELGGGTVGRDGREDRPLGGEVLVDLPGQDALAAPARLGDQEEQRLRVALQLERAAARDVAEQLDAVAEAERLGVLAVGSAEVAGEARRPRRRGPTRRARAGTASGRACRGSGPVCVIRSRSLAWCSRPAKSSKSQPLAIVTTSALRLERARLLGDRVGRRDDRVGLRRDEPPDAADGLLLQPRELRLVAAPVRMRGERVAQVGDPGRAGRALDGGAEQVERRRRRGGEHDVDLLPAHEPDRDRQRERAPGDVLVGHEQPAPEQRRLRADARESPACRGAAPTDGPRAARRSARGGSRPASAARARRPGRRRDTSGASTCVSIPSAGRCVANLSGRWTPPPPPGGKWRVTSRTFTGATVLRCGRKTTNRPSAYAGRRPRRSIASTRSRA